MANEFEHFLGFQWDQGNVDKNLINHDVNNWECEQVFFNRPLIVVEDSKHSIFEKRWTAFGKTDVNRFLIVVFTKRGDLIRVIFCRDMNRKERAFYDEKG